MDGLEEFLYSYGHLGVFLALIATGLGVPVPEDIILVIGGTIAKQTDALSLMIFVCMFGVMAGDLIIYSLGYRYGESILQRRPFSWLVTPERLRKVRYYYRKYGYWAIFISRFLAGLRATSFLMAGLSHVPLRMFILADGTAALLSVPFFIVLGYIFADYLQALSVWMGKAERGVIIAVVAAVVALIAWRLLRRKKPAPAAHAEGDLEDEPAAMRDGTSDGRVDLKDPGLDRVTTPELKPVREGSSGREGDPGSNR